MTAAYRLLTNFSLLAIADMVVKVASVLTVACYSRIVGPTGLGELSVCAAWVGYVTLFSSFGYVAYGMEKIGRSPQAADDVVSSLQSFRAWLSVIGFGALVLFVLLSGMSLTRSVLYLVTGLSILTGAYYTEWHFQSLGDMKPVAWARIGAAFCFSVFVISLITVFRHRPENVWLVPLGTAVSQVIAAGYLWRQWRRRGHSFRWVSEWPLWIRTYATYSINGFCSLALSVFFTLDLVMLNSWTTKQETGLYAGSFRLVTHLISFVYIFNGLVYPMLARYAHEGGPRMSQLISYVTRLLVTLYAPLCLIGMTLSGPLLFLFYGEEFRGGAPSLSVLLLVTLFSVANLFYAQIYLVTQRRRLMIGILLFQLALNVALNAYWIPKAGGQGAALSKLTVEMIGTLLYVFMFSQLRHIQIRTIVKPLPALAVMAIVLYVLRSHAISAWIVLPAALLAYAGSLLLSRGVTVEDFRFLVQILGKSRA